MISENLLKEQPLVKRANMVWVGDIAYIWTREGWLYFASVMDLWSRKIIGWSSNAKDEKRIGHKSS